MPSLNIDPDNMVYVVLISSSDGDFLSHVVGVFSKKNRAEEVADGFRKDEPGFLVEVIPKLKDYI